MDEKEVLAQQIAEERGSFGEPVEEKPVEGVKEETSPTPETVTPDVKEESNTLAEVTEKPVEETEEAEKVEETPAEPVEETEEEEKPLVKKDNVQKRIDRLTAEKHQRDSEIAELRKQLDIKEKETKERAYSEEELVKAERKAVEDGDVALLSEVFKERLKNQERGLINMYQKQKESEVQAIQQKQAEWNSIAERYSNDDDPSLDIRKQTSQIYLLAKSFFEDQELAKQYRGPGGMMKAVADAYVELTKARSKKKVPIDAKKNERKEAKERLKNSTAIPSGDKAVKNKESKPEDSFSDYIKEREALRQQRMGT